MYFATLSGTHPVLGVYAEGNSLQPSISAYLSLSVDRSQVHTRQTFHCISRRFPVSRPMNSSAFTLYNFDGLFSANATFKALMDR
jgi:hypothetical protein